METIDLTEKLVVSSDGWRATDNVTLTSTQRVTDPTRPGEFIYGPAVVCLDVPPDGAHILHVDYPDL